MLELVVHNSIQKRLICLLAGSMEKGRSAEKPSGLHLCNAVQKQGFTERLHKISRAWTFKPRIQNPESSIAKSPST